MSKVVIKLGRTPLQTTHHNLLRQFINDAVEHVGYEGPIYSTSIRPTYDTSDKRADFKVVCNKANYIIDSYNIACSDMSNPLLPRVIGYNIVEEDIETQESVVKAVFVSDITDEELELIDKSSPIYEEVVIASEIDIYGEPYDIYGLQPVVPFELNDSDFVILIGHVTDFTKKDVNRSNVLVLTY